MGGASSSKKLMDARPCEGFRGSIGKDSGGHARRGCSCGRVCNGMILSQLVVRQWKHRRRWYLGVLVVPRCSRKARDVRREVRDALLATIRSSTRPLYSRTEARRAWPRRSHLRVGQQAAAPNSTIFCTAVNNMAMPVALRDVARRVTST